MVHSGDGNFSAERLSVRFWRGDFGRREREPSDIAWPVDSHVPGPVSIPELPLDLPGAKLPAGIPELPLDLPGAIELPPGVNQPVPVRLPPGIEFPAGTVYVLGPGGTLTQL
ncbi:MAG: hypothetical protein HY319_07735 [Armatimonadetes bacterium]|nr:hypothetical protein [Armatimonadota bacterium]